MCRLERYLGFKSLSLRQHEPEGAAIAAPFVFQSKGAADARVSCFLHVSQQNVVEVSTGDFPGLVECLQGRCGAVCIAILGKEAREVQGYVRVHARQPCRLLVELLHVVVDTGND